MRADEPRKLADLLPAADIGKLKSIRARDYLVRFGLGVLVSIGAAVIGRAVSVRFGGLFLAFPAILPASLTLIESKEGPRRADRDAIGAVLGGFSLLVFAGICEALLTHLDAYLSLLLAFFAWVVTAVGLYALLAYLRPDDCDRTQD